MGHVVLRGMLSYGACCLWGILSLGHVVLWGILSWGITSWGIVSWGMSSWGIMSEHRLKRSDDFFDAVIEMRGSEFSKYQKKILHGPVPLRYYMIFTLKVKFSSYCQ